MEGCESVKHRLSETGNRSSQRDEDEQVNAACSGRYIKSPSKDRTNLSIIVSFSAIQHGD